MQVSAFVLTTALTLCTFLPQQPEEKIALVFGPKASDVLTVEKSKVEALYENLSKRTDLTDVEQRWLAAAVTALGTAPRNEVRQEVLTPQEVERFRWQRRPLQRRAQP